METWKAVPGFEGLYEVSDLGRVRSLDRTIERATGPATYRGRVLRQSVREVGGYASVGLSDHGVQSTHLVHELVAAAFLGPRPLGMHVCHNDGAAANNVAANLRYDTPVGNHADKLRHGTLKHSEAHHNARLNREQIAEIRRRYASGIKEDLATEFGVNANHIYRIAVRKRWAHV